MHVLFYFSMRRQESERLLSIRPVAKPHCLSVVFYFISILTNEARPTDRDTMVGSSLAWHLSIDISSLYIVSYSSMNSETWCDKQHLIESRSSLVKIIIFISGSVTWRVISDSAWSYWSRYGKFDLVRWSTDVISSPISPEPQTQQLNAVFTISESKCTLIRGCIKYKLHDIKAGIT